MIHNITQINIYPIKSLAGISMPECEVYLEGFKYDRKWMLVDQNGLFITQRQFPQLACFKTELKESILKVSYLSDWIEIPLDRKTNANLSFTTTIWDHEVLANEWSTDASKWFSKYLEKDIRLVSRQSGTQRTKRITSLNTEVPLSFADGYPYLILGTASMEKLNGKLKTAIIANRFRANIMIETEKAHQEDDWKKIKMGSAIFEVVNPCARCQVININQQSADRGNEPLKTISTYRNWDNKVFFGANTICIKEGILKVGDYIL